MWCAALVLVFWVGAWLLEALVVPPGLDPGAAVVRPATFAPELYYLSQSIVAGLPLQVQGNADCVWASRAGRIVGQGLSVTHRESVEHSQYRRIWGNDGLYPPGRQSLARLNLCLLRD